MKNLSVFELFSQTQETLQEAEEKARRETSKKIERFRISEEGEYNIRILPLAPVVGADGMPVSGTRKGYEYPLRQTFIEIKLPTPPGKKQKTINVPVIQSSQELVGYSIDIIDEYVKIARELYSDDEALIDKLGQSSYTNGLRWNYVHMLYVLDLDSKDRKGPLLWQMSNSLYKEIEAKKLSLWRREQEKSGKKITCPISSFRAYPVIVTRTNENGRVKYMADIDRDIDELTEQDLMKLIDAQRIQDIVYHFTRYHLEAELEFLKQFDERNGIDVCSQQDFKDAYDRLYKELPNDDTSHFSVDKAIGDEKKSDVDGITIDDLWAEFDKLQDEGVGAKSQQYSDFREKLRSYSEAKKLDVRLSHSKNNQQILEDIEQAEEEGRYVDEGPKKVADVEEEQPKRRPRQVEEKKPEDEVEEKSEERPVRRRPRPVVEDVEEEPEQEEKKDEEAPVIEEPRRPKRR